MTTETGADREPDPFASLSMEDLRGPKDVIWNLIREPRGPVHAGPGPQHNYFIPEVNIPQPVRRPPRYVCDDEERSLRPLFVPPDGWSRAAEVLRDARIVLLYGAPGTGRRSAALRLLGECPQRANSRIRELSWEPEPEPDAVSGQRLDSTDLEQGDRLLLDLSEADNEQFSGLRRELESLRGDIVKRDAWLVVVLTADQESEVRSGLRQLLVKVERPDGAKVFQRHLAQRRIGYEPPTGQLRNRLNRVLRSAPVHELARLAFLIAEARDVRSSDNFAEWLAVALAARENRAHEVANLLAKHPDGSSRALLLAAAMFEGWSSDTVYEAEQLLLHSLKFEPDSVHKLERAGLGARLKSIGAEIGDDYRVRFTKLNYAEAVRIHFWMHFPGLRDELSDWIRSCGKQIGASAERDRLVNNFVTQCSRAGTVDHLTRVAEGWADDGGVWRLSEKLLELGLVDGRLGQSIRQKFYQWAYRDRLSPRLAEIVINLCVGVIAPNQPSQAIIRLYYLAKHPDEMVWRVAEEGLYELTNQRRFLRRLLARLTDPEYSRLSNSRDRRIFLRIFEPDRLVSGRNETRSLLADRVVRRQLVSAWRSVLTEAKPVEYNTTIQRWLQAQTNDPGDGALLSVLIDACDGAPDRFGVLIKIGRQWLAQTAEESGHAARIATVVRLEKSIDLAWESASSGSMSDPSEDRDEQQ